MTISTGLDVQDVYYDPYDVALNADPYPMFARLREEAPLYYNVQHDFYALSRFADVDKGLVDHGTFSSARGIIVELIKAKDRKSTRLNSSHITRSRMPSSA